MTSAALTFLSTPSARRATQIGVVLETADLISIHALREEGDATSLFAQILSILFLSTPSARRATGDWLDSWDSGAISIHALREEGDLS